MIPQIKVTNMAMTPAIRDYVEKKLAMLDKFWKGDPDGVVVDVEIADTTKHHKQGKIFKCEIMATSGAWQLRAVAEEEDLYAAIDVAKDDLHRQLASDKSRRETVFRRGAAALKRLLRRGEE